MPGKVLYLSALLSASKFKGRGKKAGAIAGWKLLSDAKVAKIVEKKPQRGTDKVP